MTRTAFITGARGQDGQLLTELLLNSGDRVVGLVKAGESVASDVKRNVRYVDFDLQDQRKFRALLREEAPDEIYHLAAAHHSSEKKSSLVDAEMHAVNLLATQTMLDVMAGDAPQCRFVFAASSQMYTALNEDLSVNETTVFQPSTYYGWTKASSVELIRYLRRKYRVNAGSAILFNHESHLRNPSFVTRKIALACARIKKGLGERLELFDLNARADWCAARDVVIGLQKMARYEKAEDFVFGGGRLLSVQDLVRAAFAEIGVDPKDRVVETQPTKEKKPALCSDPQKAEQLLGWRATTSMDNLMREMVRNDLEIP